jgi:FKBP-type peptidyl-prolyl cis-trans isomerase
MQLEDGTMLDSSRERGQPLLVKVGEGRAIACTREPRASCGGRSVNATFVAGWDKALPMLSRGQVAKITCPPELAYGMGGMGKCDFAFDLPA